MSYYGSEMDLEFTRIKRGWARFAHAMFVTGIVIGWITCSLFWLFMGWLP